jgi:branched-chain amino acid transport system permease protein
MPTPRSERGARARIAACAPGRARPAGGALIALLVVAVALLLLAAPALVNNYWLRILSNIFMYAVLAQGINIMAGYTGYPAFGNVVFFGLSGYTTAILMVKLQAPFALGMLAGVALCPILVLAIGPPLLRLKGHYFAIATLGFNEAVKEVVSNTAALTGGGMGMSLPLPPWGPVASAAVFYYLFLATTMLSTWVTWEFGRRRLGIACCAIRDNEEKAGAIGLHTTRYKTTAWMISATMTGAVGSVNAYWMTYVDPPSVFDMAISVKAFVIFLLGGAGTVLGPVAGALVVELLQTYTWSNLLNWHLGAMGLLIMLVIMLFPDGLREAMRRAPSFASLAAHLRRNVVGPK